MRNQKNSEASQVDENISKPPAQQETFAFSKIKTFEPGPRLFNYVNVCILRIALLLVLLFVAH